MAAIGLARSSVWPFLGAVLLTATAARPAQAEIRGEIVDWGLSEGDLVANEPDRESTGLAPAKPIEGLRYREKTDRIVVAPCRKFGITVALTATAGERLPRRVQVRVEHPQFTRPDGATSAQDTFTSDILDDGRTHVGFTFEQDWEMRPGDWTIVVATRGTEIARKAFTILPPPDGERLADCSAAPKP